ncbi:alpha/beta hydrolase [Sulfurimonas sp.]|uniref:alpha/beta hydrolase n=1 Tax=Sulfurimonas sp. TaxID=2022749 RepID=UPI003D14F327
MTGKLRNGLVTLLLLTLGVFSGCGDYGNEGKNSVGNNLVSAEVVEEVNASTMLSIVQASIKADATNAFGYKAVKIIYTTTNQDGASVTASGLLVIPSATDTYKATLALLNKSFSISMICDNHGTMFLNSEAPTEVEVTDGLPNYSVAVLMTGYAGFAAVLPDYIGYGDSNSTSHPYILKNGSAQASLDMIRASVKYMTDNNIVYNGQLYVTGYSEGGYVAMSLAKDIEQNHSDEFTLMGVAPMAGPYSPEDLADQELNASKTMVYPAFLGYLANSYAAYYNDVDLSDILATDINTTTFPALFAGGYSSTEIHVALGLTTGYGYGTYTADNLFSTTFINDYQNNVNNSVKVRLGDNIVNDWSPRSEFKLIHCVDDEIIPYTQTTTAYTNLLANDVNVTISPIPTAYLSQQVDATHPFVHANCATEAYGAAVTWFNEIRSR